VEVRCDGERMSPESLYSPSHSHSHFPDQPSDAEDVQHPALLLSARFLVAASGSPAHGRSSALLMTEMYMSSSSVWTAAT